MTHDRAAYINGLRQLADWLDANPDIPADNWDHTLIPVMTKARVDKLAKILGTEPHENTHTPGQHEFSVSFGPVSVLIYGYEDWDAHHARHQEQQARRWADRNGHELVTKADA